MGPPSPRPRQINAPNFYHEATQCNNQNISLNAMQPVKPAVRRSHARQSSLPPPPLYQNMYQPVSFPSSDIKEISYHRLDDSLFLDRLSISNPSCNDIETLESNPLNEADTSTESCESSSSHSRNSSRLSSRQSSQSSRHSPWFVPSPEEDNQNLLSFHHQISEPPSVEGSMAFPILPLDITFNTRNSVDDDFSENDTEVQSYIFQNDTVGANKGIIPHYVSSSDTNGTTVGESANSQFTRRTVDGLKKNHIEEIRHVNGDIELLQIIEEPESFEDGDESTLYGTNVSNPVPLEIFGCNETSTNNSCDVASTSDESLRHALLTSDSSNIEPSRVTDNTDCEQATDFICRNISPVALVSSLSSPSTPLSTPLSSPSSDLPLSLPSYLTDDSNVQTPATHPEFDDVLGNSDSEDQCLYTNTTLMSPLFSTDYSFINYKSTDDDSPSSPSNPTHLISLSNCLRSSSLHPLQTSSPLLRSKASSGVLSRRHNRPTSSCYDRPTPSFYFSPEKKRQRPLSLFSVLQYSSNSNHCASSYNPLSSFASVAPASSSIYLNAGKLIYIYLFVNRILNNFFLISSP